MTVHALDRDIPADYSTAVEAYLRSAGIAASSPRIYRISLLTWAWLAVGQQPPLGRNRRGAEPPTEPPTVAFAMFDEAPANVIAEMFAQRARLVDADTVNRELSVMKAAIAWWRARGWLTRNPIIGIERRPAPPDRTRALSREQIATLFDLKVNVRERTLWKALYETCARAEEILCLDVEDLLLTDKRGRVTSKGGTIEWVHWQRAPPNSCPGYSKAVSAGLCSLRTAGRLPTSPRVTHAQLPGAPACLTGEPPNSSRPSPGRSPVRASPTQPNSRHAADGRCTNCATPR
ncbi:hypothetical protein ABZU32_38900 [Sphaerisporangium sp. NPDC005288]|uniref:hypothetical protein n=1 Tax=Sphaerisporangium sp. NPDC005288 TaxID=3155114 RepID=UPI0033B68D0B